MGCLNHKKISILEIKQLIMKITHLNENFIQTGFHRNERRSDLRPNLTKNGGDVYLRQGFRKEKVQILSPK